MKAKSLGLSDLVQLNNASYLLRKLTVAYPGRPMYFFSSALEKLLSIEDQGQTDRVTKR